MSGAIEYEVDQLLLEHGEYLPLELLLGTGRLMYPDYQAWRAGELACLDDALFGDAEQLALELAHAEDYLQRRGWRAESVSYRLWNPDAGTQPLRFSANAPLDECFHRAYRRPQDQPQLDLFTDAPGTILYHGVLDALEQRNAPEARRLLARLYDVAPDQARLGELERLTEALEALKTPVTDAAAELERLEEHLIPLAEGLLGPKSRDLLVLCWQRLAGVLDGLPFDTRQPRLHLSYAAARAWDWRRARAAVEAEAGWQREPVLLERFAIACERQQAFHEALPAWFTVCWHFPEQASGLEGSGNRTVTEAWLAFQDLDPALPVPDFPGWLLVAHPGLAKVLPDPADADCPESYAIVHRLQRRAASSTPDAEAMTWRARLKAQDPAMFAVYMAALKARAQS